MPTNITLEDGSTIEAYTPEEVEEIKNQATEEQRAEIEAKEAELAKANEELEKFRGKDLNFGNLRSQKEAAEAQVKELTKGLDERIKAAQEETRKEILESVLADHKNETLKSLVGEDEELKKKVELHYNRLTDPATTKEEITKKLSDAYFLATKPEGENALTTSVISSGGVAPIRLKPKEGQLSPEEKALAQKLADAGGLGKLEEQDFNV